MILKIIKNNEQSLLSAFLVFNLLLVGCKTPAQKQHIPKGELAFLLQYNNRLPSDVGFLTNHIIERRMANLMKENYVPFIKTLFKESPLTVDTLNHVIFATWYGQVSTQHVIVDVVNDAVWIDYTVGNRDTTLHYADQPLLRKPELN